MSKEPIFYGGQAVIGGVLINSPKGWSLAVRDNNGEINRYFEKREPLVKRNSILGAPFIRGVAALLDSLIVGYRGIDLSDRIVYDQDNELTVLNKIMNYLIVIGVLFLLIVGPRLLIDLGDASQSMKGLIEGILRGVILFLYIYFLAKTKEAQELFEYHGAEHMTIAAYEEEENLKTDSIKNYPKEHMRCGTSFLFLIIFVSLLTLPFIPTLGLLGTLVTRILHVLFVAMVSYEILKINFRFEGSMFSNIFGLPGLWVQKITTKEPSDSQIEVAQVAMANAIFFSKEDEPFIFDKLLSKAKEVSNG
tara:strand:- start:311 stop:1228 length:918 start_codon:yes stop_codon:yes gene_type:complete